MVVPAAVSFLWVGWLRGRLAKARGAVRVEIRPSNLL